MAIQNVAAELTSKDLWHVNGAPSGENWASFSFEGGGLARRCDGPEQNLLEPVTHITAQAARLFVASELAYEPEAYEPYIEAYKAAQVFEEAMRKV